MRKVYIYKRVVCMVLLILLIGSTVVHADYNSLVNMVNEIKNDYKKFPGLSARPNGYVNEQNKADFINFINKAYSTVKEIYKYGQEHPTEDLSGLLKEVRDRVCGEDGTGGVIRLWNAGFSAEYSTESKEFKKIVDTIYESIDACFADGRAEDGMAILEENFPSPSQGSTNKEQSSEKSNTGSTTTQEQSSSTSRTESGSTQEQASDTSKTESTSSSDSGSQATTAGGSRIKVEDFRRITDINVSGDGTVANLGGAIIFVVQYVGYTIAVLVLIGIGIKYMMSSPNEKADLKARLIPYAIGAIILFGGTTAISIIYDIVTN